MIPCTRDFERAQLVAIPPGGAGKMRVIDMQSQYFQKLWLITPHWLRALIALMRRTARSSAKLIQQLSQNSIDPLSDMILRIDIETDFWRVKGKFAWRHGKRVNT